MIDPVALLNLAGSLMVFADASGDAQPQAGNNWTHMIVLGLICYFVFYFVMVRPQKRHQQEYSRMLDSLQKNAQVRTRAGILGKVVSVDKDQDLVTLKIDEQNNVRMRVTRSSIEAVLSESPASGE